MELVIFLVYSIIILLIPLTSKASTNKAYFYVNARMSNVATVASSIVASCIGASATIGVVGLAFKVGTPAFWWLGSGALGLLVLAKFLAKKVRFTQAYTLSEIVKLHLGNGAAYLTSVIVVIAWTAIVAAQLTACNLLIHALTGVSQTAALMVSAFLISIHTIFGGQESIMKLDRIQCVIIVIGLIIAAVWLGNYNSAKLIHFPFEIVNKEFSIGQLLYYLLILGGSYVVCPMLYGRVLSAKNEVTAQKGVLIAAVSIALISIVIVCMGLLSRDLIPANTPTDLVLATVLRTVFPNWLTVMIYLVLISAVISSADSCLLTASTTLSHHIFKKDSLLSTRLCTVLLMAIAMILTFAKKGILELLLMANDIYVCSIVVPVFLCLFFSKNKEHINTKIAVTGMILAGILGISSSIYSNYYFSYAGIAVAIIFTLASFKFLRNKE